MATCIIKLLSLKYTFQKKPICHQTLGLLPIVIISAFVSAQERLPPVLTLWSNRILDKTLTREPLHFGISLCTHLTETSAPELFPRLCN